MKLFSINKLRFSLRFLLALFTVIALLLGYFGYLIRLHEKELIAAKHLEEAGASLLWSEPSAPLWFRKLIVHEKFSCFVGVVEICPFYGDDPRMKFDNDDFQWILACPKILKLTVERNEINTNGLSLIGSLKDLEYLRITKIAGCIEDLSFLSSLKKLKQLNLEGLHISDPEYLRWVVRLPKLEILVIDGSTPLTKQAIPYLEKLNGLKYLRYCDYNMDPQLLLDFYKKNPHLENIFINEGVLQEDIRRYKDK